MFCPQCGNKLPDGAAFCGECGASVKARVDAAGAPDAAQDAATASAAAPSATAPAAGQAPAAAQAQASAAPAAYTGTPGAASAPGDSKSSVDLLALFFEHKKKFAIGGGVLVAVIAVALFLTPSSNTTTSQTGATSTTSAASTTNDDSSESQTETVQVTKATKVPLSKALSKKGVWFWSSKGISSSTDELPDALVFDGKGNVTEYKTTGLTAMNLKDKSTDEIIKLIKKADKEWFKEEKQADIDRYNEAIASVKKKIAAIQNGTESGNESSYTKDLNNYQEFIKQIKALEYEAPSANPFSIHIITGADGKSTNTETIQLTTYKERRVYASTDEEDEHGAKVEYICSEGASQIEFTESSASGVSSFSGMSFRQFGSLTTRLDDGVNEQYVLDKSTAKGVIVDI